MTIGKMPEWYLEAEPYFIYDEDELRISDDAPEDLKQKFKDYMDDEEN